MTFCSSFFAYGQSTTVCTTCGWPSTEIMKFVDFANQIIATLPNNSNLKNKGAQYRVYWPRQWWVYNGILSSTNPGSIVENIVGWTLKNIDKKQSYIRANIELAGIYSFDIIKDGVLGFIVTAQPRPIIRDYQTLLDIDTTVSDKIYEIGIAGGYGKELSPEQLVAIKEIIQKNSGTTTGALFLSNPVINNSLTSTQALAIIIRLNQRFKNSLVLWSINGNQQITVGNSNPSTVNVNDKLFVNMKQAYSCTRIWTPGIKSCSSNFATFKKNITNIVKNFKDNGPEKSREKIDTASKRLVTRALQVTNQTDSEFYKKNIEDYQQRENELLSAQWKTKRVWSVRNVIKGWGVSNIPRQIKNSIAEIKTTRKDAKSKLVSIIESTKNTTSTSFIDKIRSLLQKKPDPIDYALQLPTSAQQANIQTDLQEILDLHNQTLETKIATTTTDTQSALAKTLFQIRLINNILYKNIKEDIARTCELQCSNLGWVCR